MGGAEPCNAIVRMEGRLPSHATSAPLPACHHKSKPAARPLPNPVPTHSPLTSQAPFWCTTTRPTPTTSWRWWCERWRCEQPRLQQVRPAHAWALIVALHCRHRLLSSPRVLFAPLTLFRALERALPVADFVTVHPTCKTHQLIASIQYISALPSIICLGHLSRGSASACTAKRVGQSGCQACRFSSRIFTAHLAVIVQSYAHRYAPIRGLRADTDDTSHTGVKPRKAPLTQAGCS